ncbi:MAG: MazG family protein, partial [Oscillospiraceae bacterium]|nr:MazG family protein [Oscillospiraceae bacterium]
MATFPEKDKYTYDDLVELLRILRAPDGCPWDREQTHLSNRRNFLEEAYEAAEAFDRDDPALMCEELGDMLMQVLFNIHIEEDAGRFTADDVTDHVVRKLIYRHPHVFSNARADSAEEVLANWEQLKRKEKGQRSAADALDAVARSLPALWRADKLLKRAGYSGLGAVNVPDELSDAVRAMREAAEAFDRDDPDMMCEELGDMLMQVLFNIHIEEDAGRFTT